MIYLQNNSDNNRVLLSDVVEDLISEGKYSPYEIDNEKLIKIGFTREYYSRERT